MSAVSGAARPTLVKPMSGSCWAEAVAATIDMAEQAIACHRINPFSRRTSVSSEAELPAAEPV